MKYILDDIRIESSYARLLVTGRRLFRKPIDYSILVDREEISVCRDVASVHTIRTLDTFDEEYMNITSSPEIWNAVRVATSALAQLAALEKLFIDEYTANHPVVEFFDETAEADDDIIIGDFEALSATFKKEIESGVRLEKQNNKQRAGRRTSRKPTKRTANKKRAVARKPRKSGGR